MSGIRHVYVLAPDESNPVGGMKSLYRHVDILNASGFSSFAVHGRRGFRCRWFENSTRVTSPPLDLGPEDVVVVPEVFAMAFRDPVQRSAAQRLRRLFRRASMAIDTSRDAIARARRIVILNLNAYHSFHGTGLGSRAEATPYEHPRLAAVLAVSADNEDYLRFAFPKVRVVRFTKAVDPDRFAPSRQKRNWICFMPRKLRTDVEQVLGILRNRGALEGFELVPIENQSESNVARILAEARIFLSFSHAEGLPRPPMEAMLSGCLVIGYHGRGGREYLDAEHGWPIEEGDIPAFARAAEAVLATLRRNPNAFDGIADRARSLILERYSPAREEREIVAFWRDLAAESG